MHLNIAWGILIIKKIVYLKFKFSWVFSSLSGILGAEEISYAMGLWHGFPWTVEEWKCGHVQGAANKVGCFYMSYLVSPKYNLCFEAGVRKPVHLSPPCSFV